MKNFFNRFVSLPTIAALLALVYFVVKNWVGFDIPGWDKFVALFCAVLAALGVLNNPTDKQSF